MTLSELADLSQVISCGIVFISVIFLARQLHQAEINQQALIQQGRAARISTLSQQMAQHGVSEAWEKGIYGHPISLSELHQFRYLCRAMFMSAEDSFFQYERRVLHEEGYESFRKSIEVMMRLPGLQAMWIESAPMYGTKFATFMNDVVARAPVETDADELERWSRAVDAAKNKDAR
ncbi:MAG: hypothetical protein JSR81_08275 [Proteobacteria bacterium]|nr:hypothetical protein [Pseudomonadota bacterium]